MGTEKDKTDILRQQIIFAGRNLLEKGFVSRSWGNISVRVTKEIMLITPSGRTYDTLQPEELVLMNIPSCTVIGEGKPSSEYRLHAQIYNKRPDAGAVIHTHQPYATTMAVTRKELPPVTDDMAQIIGRSVKVTKYRIAGTGAFGRHAAKLLKNRNAVFLANHGTVCVGRDLDEAQVVTEVLEKSCKAYIEAELLGDASHINAVNAMVLHELYLKKYSNLNNK